jgi:excisionase family DNA binding protein
MGSSSEQGGGALPGGGGEEEPWLLNPSQVARRLSASRSKVYELLNAGLPSVKIDGCRRVRTRDLQRWLDELSD